MKIDRIQIDAYGRLRDWRHGDLQDAKLIVLLGGNESGKSSVLSFLESMLYGFAPGRASEHPYFPWDGGGCGGSLQLSTEDGESLDLRRSLKDRPLSWLHRGAESKPIANAALLKNWPSRLAYRRVFYLDHEELARPTAAVWRELETRLASGWDGPSFRDPSEAVALLHREAKALWRPDRRGRPSASRLTERLNRLAERRRTALGDRDRMDELKRQSEDQRRALELSTARKRQLEEWGAEAELRRPLKGMRQQLRLRSADLRLLEDELASAEASAVADNVIAKKPQPVMPWAAAIVATVGLSLLGWMHPVVGILLLAMAAVFIIHRSRRQMVSAQLTLDTQNKERIARRRASMTRAAAAMTAEKSEIDRLESTLGRSHPQGLEPREMREEISVLSRRISSLLQAQGRVDAELRRLSGAASVDDIDGEVDAIKEELDEVRLQRDRRNVAATILERVRCELGDGLSPRFVERASTIFNALTRGRYQGLFALEEAGRPRLYLRRSKGTEPVPAQAPVSRGTAQQAWLAFRLALVDDLDRAADRLPLLLDEVFSEWDRHRIDGAAQILEEMSEHRQIFIATARPELATAFRRRGAVVIRLETEEESAGEIS
ncbi:MAG: AAA family ATPase [Planctomycetota bacterium]